MYSSQNFIFFLSFLLPLAHAAGPLINGGVGAESVSLQYKGCTADQITKLSQAWDDALKINKAVGTIDWLSHAAVDFFGPPSVIKDYQSSIQAVFNHINTFPQGSNWNPHKWYTYMTCGKSNDIDKKCGDTLNTRAYQYNTKEYDGTGGRLNTADGWSYMHFCDGFFTLDKLDDVVKDTKDSKVLKYDLSAYVNAGYIVHHEMMHATMMTYDQNKKRRPDDYKMQIYKWKPDGGSHYIRRLTRADCYGAANTRILARTDVRRVSGIAKYTSNNADTYAQYALSVYVQSKLDSGKGYPYLPIADQGAANPHIEPRNFATIKDDSGWGINEDIIATTLEGKNFAFTITDIDENSAEAKNPPETVIKDLDWIPDDQYPADYIKQRNEYIKQRDGNAPAPAQGAPAAPPSSPLQAPKCTGLDSKKYVNSKTLRDNIKDFCSQAAKQAGLDKDSGSVLRNFNKGSPDEVTISIDFTSGPTSKADETECNTVLNLISDGCDGNDPKNPMNYKGGGKSTKGPATYGIFPQAPRQDLPNKPGGDCDVQYLVGADKFYIWGNGYASSSYGQESDGLLSKLKDCGLLKSWKFNYGLGKDGREWSAEGTLPIWTAKCIQGAIKKAGGPSVDCSGDA